MRFTTFTAVLLAGFSLLADPPKTEKTDKAPQPPPFPLQYRQGKITVEGGIAALNVPSTFKYLDSKDAKKVLVEAWGNPPESAEGVLGMLVPAKVDPLAENGWAMIITYDEDGYVKDDEAEKIDYGKLLKEMQESTAQSSKERVEAGYGSMELVGWATPPRYDKAAHKLYWAKELKFGESKENTLNYDIRALGRRGVLVVKAVAGKSQLAAVESEIPKVLGIVEFNEGHKYTDFVPGADKVAAYGVGALIAGKLAAKVGFFKWIVPLLFASKKLLVVGLAAIGGAGAKLFQKFFGKKDEQLAETPEAPSDGGTAA